MGTTSKMGIDYPASTDFVKDGATNMQTIADRIDFKSGLIKIVPTVSGTGASVASNGTVTVASGGTSFTVINAFSADFEAYEIVITDMTLSTDAGILFQLRTSTTTSTTAYYTVNGYGAANYNGLGSTVSSVANQTSFDPNVLSGAGGGGGGRFTLFNPFLAKKTVITGVGSDARTTGNGRLSFSGFHDLSTSYVSLVVSSAANFTRCRLAVYGLNI